MTEGFQIVSNRCDRSACDIRFLNQQVADKATAFHSSFPQYRPTPLRRLQALAGQMGWAKSLSRMSLIALGSTHSRCWAVRLPSGNIFAQRLSRDLSELPYSVMTSPEVKGELGELTFVTATDGNHGRGVAWTANQLGQKSVVYMPKGSAPERLENIRKENSDASITDLRYDDTVRLAKQRAEQPNCVLVQDTSWDGYTEVPSWILHGYTTMANEVREELESQSCWLHAHLFAGGRRLDAGGAGRIFYQYLCAAKTHHHGGGAKQGRLHLPHRQGRGWQAGFCRRGDEHHHGRTCLRRALPHRLGGAARLR